MTPALGPLGVKTVLGYAFPVPGSSPVGRDRTAAGVSFFYLMPLPMLASENAAAGKAFDGWHQTMEWTLLVVIGLHEVAALVHIFVYRDCVMQRKLPDPLVPAIAV